MRRRAAHVHAQRPLQALQGLQRLLLRCIPAAAVARQARKDAVPAVSTCVSFKPARVRAVPQLHPCSSSGRSDLISSPCVACICELQALQGLQGLLLRCIPAAAVARQVRSHFVAVPGLHM